MLVASASGAQLRCQRAANVLPTCYQRAANVLPTCLRKPRCTARDMSSVCRAALVPARRECRVATAAGFTYMVTHIVPAPCAWAACFMPKSCPYLTHLMSVSFLCRVFMLPIVRPDLTRIVPISCPYAARISTVPRPPHAVSCPDVAADVVCLGSRGCSGAAIVARGKRQPTSAGNP